MVNFKKEPRDLKQTVVHIREAIDLADDLNWDVNDWQKMLAGWTSDGTVTVIDETN
ncbi:hypothetical protein N7931_15570 [Catenovulum sp. 2E275]|uniref:hypothetical protein n=1 Tax=Catenovulum sp. 2E275 TaxID=2980497 RepID=UPI0021D16866|nr:hypothetical protein [Catenovulum sp. 2E275]MCU4677052.1 hypothetical protein [Catenovulum sp. 2E275]